MRGVAAGAGAAAGSESSRRALETTETRAGRACTAVSLWSRVRRQEVRCGQRGDPQRGEQGRNGNPGHTPTSARKHAHP